MSTLHKKQARLKKLKIRNITLNTVCICLAVTGIVWTVNYFWRYANYEITNDAMVDQYIAPLNIRASGYIKEVRFTEHQHVEKGDTLLVLDDREYRIRLKDAEAALMDARGSKDVLSSGIETGNGTSPLCQPYKKASRQSAGIRTSKSKLRSQQSTLRSIDEAERLCQFTILGNK